MLQAAGDDREIAEALRYTNIKSPRTVELAADLNYTALLIRELQGMALTESYSYD